LGYYAETPEKATCDLAYHVRIEGTTCYIPFDPTAVVENLRRERYLGRNLSDGGDEKQARLVRKAYYRRRLHLDVPIHRRLRRLWWGGGEKKCFPSRPVDRTVDQLLEKLLALAMKAHRIEKIPFIWFWPEGQKSCAILAHEVEESSYDMSVPSVEDVDSQRGGCCTIMPFFIGNVLELPVTMTRDCELFNTFSGDSLELWQRESRLITENHGLLSFITHPDFVPEERARATCAGLLAHLARLRRQGEVWMAPPRDVNRWWRERARMTIAREAGRWRIEGPGRERARLAYACLTGDRITYTFEPSPAERPLALAAAA